MWDEHSDVRSASHDNAHLYCHPGVVVDGALLGVLGLLSFVIILEATSAESRSVAAGTHLIHTSLDDKLPFASRH
jgi:hypothetical protein